MREGTCQKKKKFNIARFCFFPLLPLSSLPMPFSTPFPSFHAAFSLFFGRAAPLVAPARRRRPCRPPSLPFRRSPRHVMSVLCSVSTPTAVQNIAELEQLRVVVDRAPKNGARASPEPLVLFTRARASLGSSPTQTSP
jgi:hypothetical protein